MISVEYLQRLFPAHRVTHNIRSGDSPDYHHFEVVADDGEVLFTISSFLDAGEQEGATATNPVRIDILKVVSPRIPDPHGMRVGNRVADVVQARGRRLEFGASHHDLYLGGSQIFYNIRTSSGGSPERFTFEDALRENWTIVSISWPAPAWE